MLARRQGIELTMASSRDERLRTAADTDYELLLLDIQLPVPMALSCCNGYLLLQPPPRWW